MALRRNDKSKPLVLNGKNRHGQFSWHDAECEMEDHGFIKSGGSVHHALWCATHGQWAHETPIKKLVVFEDGRIFPV